MYIPVPNGDRNLARNFQSCRIESNNQCVLVNRLDKTVPQVVINIEENPMIFSVRSECSSREGLFLSFSFSIKKSVKFAFIRVERF